MTVLFNKLSITNALNYRLLTDPRYIVSNSTSHLSIFYHMKGKE